MPKALIDRLSQCTHRDDSSQLFVPSAWVKARVLFCLFLVATGKSSMEKGGIKDLAHDKPGAFLDSPKGNGKDGWWLGRLESRDESSAQRQCYVFKNQSLFRGGGFTGSHCVI